MSTTQEKEFPVTSDDIPDAQNDAINQPAPLIPSLKHNFYIFSLDLEVLANDG